MKPPIRGTVIAIVFFLCRFANAIPSPPDTAPATLQISSAEFIFEKAPFPSCHASTIAQRPDGDLVAAWFGGTAEGQPDVGIWSSIRHNGQWSKVREVADGKTAGAAQVACWNPVLFQSPGGPLLLFYRIGAKINAWKTMLRTSADGGSTWSLPAPLPDGFLGPIKDKPVLLADGSLLCPSSTESNGWRVHLETTSDLGKTWAKTADLNEPADCNIIQPTILVHDRNSIQILCRNKHGPIMQSRSFDAGKTWSPMQPTELPNPNSGIDAVVLRDGRSLLVYNNSSNGRSPLNVAMSPDGNHWTPCLTLEDAPGEYSYPAVIQSADGNVHITYTWNRQKIRHVVLTLPAQG